MASDRYTLYYSPGAASLCVHWLLIEADLPFDAVLVDFSTGVQRTETYRQLNPTGRVPTLIVDGEARGECTALLMLLAERHPDRGLMPAVGAPLRALWLQTMIYLANTLLPAMRDWFYADQDGPAEGAAAVRGLAQRRIEGAWDLLDVRLRGSANAPGLPLTPENNPKYLVGDTLSTVDFLAVMLMRWSRDMPRPATHWPHLASYVDHLTALPSFHDVCRREGLSNWPAVRGSVRRVWQSTE
ncbi:glutathione S-transferase family protein [Aspergillus saccharolyticus JOP 1030-1]|uniref:Glutathione S-transferase n=1 Tax=Aspergillus saccharolyticus JOP 1030-1 TaxID=1450539 RepID=A0A318ZM93_9EURO|nr:glutathione S-transferase [Aspergillus saccharolyticus JOP 1030-1]PYH48709.1 glutathione S-transferase [Aspergillus saccharolyticus JOP 1030-1]